MRRTGIALAGGTLADWQGRPDTAAQAGDVGTITIDPAAVTTAAADTLRRHPAVRTAKGKAITHRGTRTIELAVTAAHPDELAAVISAIIDACEHIAHATGHAPLSIKGGGELTRQPLR